MMKWIPGNVRINQQKLNATESDAEMHGMVAGCWGITTFPSGTIRVTHLPTGLAAYSCTGYPEAVLYCEKMDKQGDWSEATELRAWDAGNPLFEAMRDADRIARLLVKEQM